MAEENVNNEEGAENGAGEAGGKAAVDINNPKTALSESSDADKGEGAEQPAADATGGDPEKNEGKQPAEGAWPDDWRNRLAGDDEKSLKLLERYGSLKDFYDAQQSLRKKVDSGEFKNSKKPEDETELKEWREQNGVPEKPEDYLADLPDESKVEEDDKPVIDMFLKEMHGIDATKEQVQKSLKAYNDAKQEAEYQQYEKDENAKDETIKALKEEWGAEYKKNSNLITALVSQAPTEIQDDLMNARLGDGTPLMSNSSALRWLNGIARENNPTHTIVTGGLNQSQSVDDRLSEIKKVMDTNRSEYNRDEKMQAEYRSLLEWKDKNPPSK